MSGLIAGDRSRAILPVQLARPIISARVTAGLTQEQLAQRMETTHSVIARLEGARR